MPEPVRSMTGSGTHVVETDAGRFEAEARSVNNRFLKLSLRTPGLLSAKEHEIEALVRERVERGTVYMVVRVVLDEPEVKVRLNESAVLEYKKLLGKLRKTAGIAGDLTHAGSFAAR